MRLNRAGKVRVLDELDSPPVCDYEDGDYQHEFWPGREFEDQVERIALRKFLPMQGKRLLELGAGFGRLTNELMSFEQIVLLDYARPMLKMARSTYGDEKCVYVAANIYQLPFRPGTFDAATMFRVIHHLSEPQRALESIRGVLTTDATFVLEFANKRNVKVMLQYLVKGRNWSWCPYDMKPHEEPAMVFYHHPNYVAMLLQESGFAIQDRIPISYLRLPLLKRLFPTKALVSLDLVLQRVTPLWAPSVVTSSLTVGTGPDITDRPLEFCCPLCKGDLQRLDEDTLACQTTGCGKHWQKSEGIYDFKEPIV